MEFWKIAYDRKWATLDQMKLAVAKNKITADQYKEITGEDYTADSGGAQTTT